MVPDVKRRGSKPGRRSHRMSKTGRILFQAKLNRTTIFVGRVFVPGRSEPGGLGLVPGRSVRNERGLSVNGDWEYMAKL